MAKYCFLCGKDREIGLPLHGFPKDDKLCALWKEICELDDRDDVRNIKICKNHFVDSDYDNVQQVLKYGGKLFLKRGAFPSVKTPKKVVKEVLVSVPGTPQFDDNMSRSVLSEIVSDIFDENSSDRDAAVTVDPQSQSQDVLLYVPSTSEQTPFEIIYKTPEKSTPIIEEIPITSTNTETAEPVANTSKKKFPEPRYLGDVDSSDLTTTQRARRALNLAQQTVTKKNLQIKTLQQRNRRLLRKINSCLKLVTRLKESKLVTEDVGNILLLQLRTTQD